MGKREIVCNLERKKAQNRPNDAIGSVFDCFDLLYEGNLWQLSHIFAKFGRSLPNKRFYQMGWVPFFWPEG
jgi:hypothetical protein